MNSLVTLTQTSIILDACCAINLATSGEAATILMATGKLVFIATYVLDREIVRPELVAVIRDLVTSGLVMTASPANETEEDTYVRLASLNLDNGESVTGAIASQRNWVVAIDENKAHREFARELPYIVRLTTPDLVFNWAEMTHPVPERLSSVIGSIQRQGRYKPQRAHKLYEWWLSHSEAEETVGD